MRSIKMASQGGRRFCYEKGSLHRTDNRSHATVYKESLFKRKEERRCTYGNNCNKYSLFRRGKNTLKVEL